MSTFGDPVANRPGMCVVRPALRCSSRGRVDEKFVTKIAPRQLIEREDKNWKILVDAVVRARFNPDDVLVRIEEMCPLHPDNIEFVKNECRDMDRDLSTNMQLNKEFITTLDKVAGGTRENITANLRALSDFVLFLKALYETESTDGISYTIKDFDNGRNVAVVDGKFKLFDFDKLLLIVPKSRYDKMKEKQTNQRNREGRSFRFKYDDGSGSDMEEIDESADDVGVFFNDTGHQYAVRGNNILTELIHGIAEITSQVLDQYKVHPTPGEVSSECNSFDELHDYITNKIDPVSALDVHNDVTDIVKMLNARDSARAAPRR